MSLQRIEKEAALREMTSEELSRWENSMCKECTSFNEFRQDDSYSLPLYFNCNARNQEGSDFVREMPCLCCSFYKN